jgi:hypothetical protein
MISLTCTTCRSLLQIDDAFAGGVCRCQHCGTIQTVPSHLKGGATATAEAKTLYKHRSRVDGQSGTGLHELADIVASSGLAHTASRDRSAASSPPAAPPKRDTTRLLLILAVIVILALVGVIVWLVASPFRL